MLTYVVTGIITEKHRLLDFSNIFPFRIALVVLNRSRASHILREVKFSCFQFLSSSYISNLWGANIFCFLNAAALTSIATALKWKPNTTQIWWLHWMLFNDLHTSIRRLTDSFIFLVLLKGRTVLFLFSIEAEKPPAFFIAAYYTSSVCHKLEKFFNTRRPSAVARHIRVPAFLSKLPPRKHWMTHMHVQHTFVVEKPSFAQANKSCSEVFACI